MEEKDKIKSYWTSWANGNVSVVPRIIELCPELAPLMHTPQSRSLHSEGTVGRHTILTCEAANDLIGAIDLNYRKIFRFAALLHDVGKPHCLIEAAPGIYSFPDVNNVSCKQARIILDKYAQLSIKEREMTLALINNHIYPVKIIQQDLSVRELYKISLESDLETLYYLAKSNYIGRKALNLRERFEIIEKFKHLCIDHNLWKGHSWGGLLPVDNFKKYGKNAQAIKNTIDWFYLTGAIENEYHARDWFLSLNEWQGGTLYFTVGPPGSGKSTWINKNYSMVPVVSSDGIRVELSGNMVDQSRNDQVYEIAHTRIKEYLRDGKQVVFDTTNVNFNKRKAIINIARNLGAHVICLFFSTTYENCLARVKNRPELPLSKEVIDEMYREFDYVSSYEYDKIIYV
ncbi:MAG: AAA family ATPase [Cyanobacteriota bacterium]